MHRGHDVSACFKHHQKHQGRCFFRTSPKNRIVKNWEASHRYKHRMIKKSERRPPLNSLLVDFR